MQSMYDHASAIANGDLPRWMRQAQRGWDWGLLLALALGLLAAWPFLLQSGLPRTNASENHTFMAADYAATLQEGRLYPRWSAFAQQGYGAPIPNYYPPAPAYAAALFEVLLTNDAVVAVRILYIAAFCLAGAALYGLARRHAGAQAGLVAAALFVFSPYFGHTAPHILGDLPAVTGLALLAALLWRIDHLLWADSAHDIAQAAFLTAALALTHPPLAAAGAGMAALLTLYALARRKRAVPWTLAGLSIIIGAGIAAFYWLPALAEQGLITWKARPRAVPPRVLPEKLFSPLPFVDLAELVPRARLTLGPLAALAAAAGTIAGAVLCRAAGFYSLFLLGGIGAAAAAVLLPAETWLVGLAALCAAVGGSGTACFARHLPQHMRRLLTPALLAAIVAVSAPVWLAPRWPDTLGDLTPAAQITYEQQGAGIAVLPPGAPLPSTLPAALPSRTPTDISNRIVHASGLQASVVQGGTHTLHLQISANTAQRIGLLMAYFPGWQAWSEGSPLALMPDPQTNLMQMQIPVMSGEALLTLGPTPPRQHGWLVSLSAVAALAMLTWLRARRRRPDADDVPFLPVPETRLLLLTLATCAALIPLFAAPFSPLTLHARPGHGLDGAVSLRDRTDAGLEAIAFRLDQDSYQPGDVLNLTLYWRALRLLDENYQAQISLYDVTRGALHYQTALRAPGDYPTRRWQPYQYVADPYTIPLALELPPDDYQITVEIYACRPACDASSRLSFFDSAGRPLGQTLNLPVYPHIAPAPAL